MPIIKSAIKKMRQDKAREKINRAKKIVLKTAVKNAKLKPNLETLSASFSALDRAAKTGLIPKGRADRKKARLTKAAGNKTVVAKKEKLPSKKTSPKKSTSR